MYDAAMNPTEG
jgi:CRP-like cAMP-binding protein